MKWLESHTRRAGLIRGIALLVSVLILIHFAPLADGLGGVSVVAMSMFLFVGTGVILWRIAGNE